MNKRQAKKWYKKIHGCNPPKTASEKWRQETQETVKLHDFNPETLQMAVDEMRKAFREAEETIQKVAENFKKAFNEAGKHLIDMTDEASRRQIQNREHREQSGSETDIHLAETGSRCSRKHIQGKNL